MAKIDIQEGTAQVLLEAPGINLSAIVDHLASIMAGAEGLRNNGCTGLITLAFVREEEK